MASHYTLIVGYGNKCKNLYQVLIPHSKSLVKSIHLVYYSDFDHHNDAMGLKSIVSIIPHYRRWGANTFQCVAHVPLGNGNINTLSYLEPACT